MTPSRIRRKISAPFRPISLNGVISAVMAPPDFSASSLVQNGCSKLLYWVRLPQAPTTFSEVLGMSWATAVAARPAVSAAVSAQVRAQSARCFIVILPQGSSGTKTVIAAAGSDYRQPAVLQIGHQHVTGRVRDTELRAHRRDHRLRRHAAGPEHGQFVVAHLDGVAVVGATEVG